MGDVPTVTRSVAGRAARRADAQMRSLAQQKPNDPNRSMLMGFIFPAAIGTGRRWRISIPYRPASGTAIFRNWRADCKVTVLESATACAIVAKNAKRKRCYVSSRPLRALR
ncbi:hypothetical protein JS565_16525 [Salmonella enterica subsp. enterica serovar Senftenberg]|nr:hypothetical protein [Salmonella enterica subsp. enterica serovar Senftenberg]